VKKRTSKNEENQKVKEIMIFNFNMTHQKSKPEKKKLIFYFLAL
jgi:hypothetical protein